MAQNGDGRDRQDPIYDQGGDAASEEVSHRTWAHGREYVLKQGPIAELFLETA
jgi:hypothetical protein